MNEYFWTNLSTSPQCASHRAAVSHVVACKDLHGEEEAGGGEGVGVAVAVDRPRTSPCFMCAFFWEQSNTRQQRATAHAAQQTAACHPSMWWQRQCCLSQTSFIKVVTLNNGLVHNTLAVCCCWWLGRRWRRPLAALSPLSGLMNIAETYIRLSSATNVNMTQRLLSSVFSFFIWIIWYL